MSSTYPVTVQYGVVLGGFCSRLPCRSFAQQCRFGLDSDGRPAGRARSQLSGEVHACCAVAGRGLIIVSVRRRKASAAAAAAAAESLQGGTAPGSDPDQWLRPERFATHGSACGRPFGGWSLNTAHQPPCPTTARLGCTADLTLPRASFATWPAVELCACGFGIYILKNRIARYRAVYTYIVHAHIIILLYSLYYTMLYCILLLCIYKRVPSVRY